MVSNTPFKFTACGHYTTEERDLATHLAGGGVATSLLLPRALEEVGELSELLVALGHPDDAAALQKAVAAAMDAHEVGRCEMKVDG